MTRTFTGTLTQTFQGRLYDAPNVSQAPVNSPPRSLGALINWATYGAGASVNVGVLINLQNLGPGSNIDNIRSVRIDNTGNPVPVYVVFPDSGFIVTCPPNAVFRESVVTQGLQCFVYGEGFTVGQIGQTGIFFSNIFLAPIFDPEISQSLDLWKASASVNPGVSIYGTNYGVPCLADQTVEMSLDLNSGAQGSSLPALTSGFYYLNALFVTLKGAVHNTAARRVISLNGGISGTVYSWTFFLDGTVLYDNLILYHVSGINEKLHATETYNLGFNIAIDQGLALVRLNFTSNPT